MVSAIVREMGEDIVAIVVVRWGMPAGFTG